MLAHINGSQTLYLEKVPLNRIGQRLIALCDVWWASCWRWQLALKTIGDLLEESGWTSPLVQAGVSTSGLRHNMLIKSQPACRKLTLSTAINWMREMMWHPWKIGALKRHSDPTAGTSDVSNKRRKLRWCSDKACALVLCLGTHQYARWIPVRLRDMVVLKHTHPDVYDALQKGEFTVKKTTRSFSVMATNQGTVPLWKVWWYCGPNREPCSSALLDGFWSLNFKKKGKSERESGSCAKLAIPKKFTAGGTLQTHLP